MRLVAGDGLSQAMKVDPQLLHQGDTVYVVMECKVGPVSFDPIKDSETECERKHVLRAGAATIVDGTLVKTAVEAQTAKIIAAEEERKGIQQLPTNENLTKAHNGGAHEHTPYIGCPECFPDDIADGLKKVGDAAKQVAAAMKPKPTARATKTSKPAAKRTRAPRKSAAKK